MKTTKTKKKIPPKIDFEAMTPDQLIEFRSQDDLSEADTTRFLLELCYKMKKLIEDDEILEQREQYPLSKQDPDDPATLPDKDLYHHVNFWTEKLGKVTPTMTNIIRLSKQIDKNLSFFREIEKRNQAKLEKLNFYKKELKAT